MSVKATFQADFSSFIEAVGKAETKMVSFQGSTANVEKSLNRMVDNFSGRKLIEDATKMARAIDDIGGPTKLTANELAQVGAKANEAAAKMKAMGIEVPPGIKNISDAAARAKRESDGWGLSLNTLKGGLAALGIGVSVGALINFGKAVLADADALVKMSDKTGISTQGLQKLQIAGDDAGNTLEQITGAVNMLQKRLAGDESSAVRAIERLGLNFDAIRLMSPDAQFMAIGDAIRGVKDPADQVVLAIELFGQRGAEILPTLKRGFDDIKDTTVGMSDEAVRGLDALGDSFTRTWRQAKAFFGEMTAVALGVHTVPQGTLLDPAVYAELHAPMLATNADIKAISLSADEQERIEKDLGQQLAITNEVRKIAKDAAEKQKAAMKLLTDQLHLMEGTKTDFKVLALADALKAVGQTDAVPTLKDVAGFSLRAATDVDTLRGSVEDLQRQGRFLSAAMVDVNQQFAILPSVVPAGTAALKEARSEADALASTFVGKLKDAVGGINDIFQRAFEGGGGALGAVQSFATNAIASVTSMIPVVGPIFSQFSGAIVAGFKKIFGGVSEAVLQARKDVAGFEQQLGATLTATQRLEAGNESWRMTVMAVEPAYLATGRSALDASRDIEALWASSKAGAGATKEAIEKINAVLLEQKQRIEDANTEFGTLMKSGQDLGVSLPEALKPSIQRLIDMGTITKENAGLFAALSGSTEVDFKKMEKLAKDYGIDLAALGPQFQSARLSASAKTIINDFKLLTDAGADVGGVLFGMRDEISELVQDSIKFGTKIPENMKPWIQELQRSGLLVDENGDKITDLSNLKFAPPIVTEFDKIVSKLQELIDKITGPLTTSLDTTLPAGVDTAAHSTHDATRRMVDDFGDVEEAVNGINFGRSPGGLKEIPILLDAAMIKMHETDGISETVFGNVYGHIRQVVGGTHDWIGAVGDTKTALDGLLTKIGDVRTSWDTIPAMVEVETDGETSRIPHPFGGFPEAPTIISEADAIARLQAVAQKYAGRTLSDAEISQVGATYGYNGKGSILKDRFETFLKRLVTEYFNQTYIGMAAGGIVPEYVAGGKVFPFMPRGTDTVPAMLTPGEAVLNRGAVARLGTNWISEMNAGRGGNNVVDLAGVRADLQALRRDLVSVVPTMVEKAARHGVQTGRKR